ncbi:MAG TPA: hypothetical protein VGJ84_16185, partial [Polyangiaceae bacterium]
MRCPVRKAHEFPVALLALGVAMGVSWFAPKSSADEPATPAATGTPSGARTFAVVSDLSSDET